MLKIEETMTSGWESALRGMRNPMDSWKRGDSFEGLDNFDNPEFKVGRNDMRLMKQLSKAGTDHRKFQRMLVVHCDITAPFYWWKEFDTYKVGTVSNSCSTMHRIASRDVTMEDVSHDHMTPEGIAAMEKLIECINVERRLFAETKAKQHWQTMIQLLPSSYNQRRTIMMNYEVVANMYHSRRGHKLTEWQTFREWAENLPHAKELLLIEE